MSVETQVVPFVGNVKVEVEELPAFMDRALLPFETIGCVNWKEYPYRPQAQFRIAYTDEALMVHYLVTEESIRAIYGQDGGKVWTDACVELFIQFPGESAYYNIESNCIGAVLVGYGNDRHQRELISKEFTNHIHRWASLGCIPFEERKGQVCWELALIIPFTVFSKRPYSPHSGDVLKANVYKCGDELSTPHFLSWNSIEVASPDFHQPAFFGQLVLE